MSREQHANQTILFIIDPQIDFHPGGSLGVPGAHEDSERIAALIERNIVHIDEIYVSLDSHHRIHIAHGVFWKNAEGKHPPPFTLIRNQDVEDGTWTPVDPNMKAHALFYTNALENKGRFVVCIWPEHCLIGTKGHAVIPSVNNALQKWTKHHMKPINYVYKGTNCLTEMYSALAAEVPLKEDSSTHLNITLLEKLHHAETLLICGEAKSHCVNYTMRDIAANWQKDLQQLVLLNDCSSAVPGFEEAAVEFEREMGAMGCRILNSTELQFS